MSTRSVAVNDENVVGVLATATISSNQELIDTAILVTAANASQCRAKVVQGGTFALCMVWESMRWYDGVSL